MKLQRGFILLASLVSACSGGADIFDGGEVDATSDASTKQDASGNDATILGDGSADVQIADAGLDVQNPDLACVNDDAGCVSCCFDRHADGAATYFDTLFTCACSTGATCHSATVCLNNLCKGYDPSVACDKCLSNPDAGDCYAKSDNACNNDPDCVAFFDCALDVCSPGDGG